MFQILDKKGKRRLGKLTTMHGDIYTPAFGPDATRGLIKNLAPHESFNLTGNFPPIEVKKLLEEYFMSSRFSERNTGISQDSDINEIPVSHLAPSGLRGNRNDISELLNNIYRKSIHETQFILSNTYHLRSYPGDEFIKEAGGLHKFMQWPLPILTDSGGFQVFSLIHGAKNLKGKVTDDGAFFNNPVTGERLELTPEKAIEIQFNLGSDIMVVLDDCRHYTDTKELKKSVYRTIEWAKRCKKRFREIIEEKESLRADAKQSLSDEKIAKPSSAHASFGKSELKTPHNDRPRISRPLLFCVVQGGIDFELRKYCVEELTKIGFDGYGFGGWAINEKEYFPYDLLEYVAARLPEDKPRYAMGVGNPENMKLCVDFGYDLFDCVIPSRNGRHGLAYTTEGDIKILNSKHKTDKSPLDPNLPSLASDYSKEYIHHLFKIQDALGGELMTIQNLKYFNYFLNNLIKD